MTPGDIATLVLIGFLGGAGIGLLFAAVPTRRR